MNTQIKRLLEQSGLQPYYDAQEGQIEKFAELLVQECAEVADNADATREKWQSIGKFVKEHFGVEE
jgi:hypothetical protein